MIGEKSGGGDEELELLNAGNTLEDPALGLLLAGLSMMRCSLRVTRLKRRRLNSRSIQKIFSVVGMVP